MAAVATAAIATATAPTRAIAVGATETTLAATTALAATWSSITAAATIAALAATTQRARASFATLDRDRNGELSFDEFFRLVSADRISADGQRLVATMDSTRDGQISLIEHRTATLANFDRLDADKDGVVSATEMKAGGIR